MTKYKEKLYELVEYDLGDTVYFLYKNKVYRKVIRGIVFPEIKLEPNNTTIIDRRPYFKFGKNSVLENDFMFKDESVEVKIVCDKCFKTLDELVNNITRIIF